jgi:hypothetical protein
MMVKRERCVNVVIVLISKVHSRGKHIQHLLSTDRASIQMEDVTVEQQLPVASPIVDVSAHAVDQPASSGPSPEVTPLFDVINKKIRQIAALLSSRLRLAAYKVSSQQIHTPLSDLAVLPADTGDKSVSLAIQRFRESKQIQDKAEYFRKHRLSTICRRESRRTRHEKKSKRKQPPTFPSTMAKRTRLIRQPSTITEVPSDQEERGLPSPPDSQPSKTPSTPAPKTKIRAAKRKATYDEYNGHLGLSSPPQQAYDPQENGRDWYMDDVEVGDVPSSVLRGVQGLWALGS